MLKSTKFKRAKIQRTLELLSKTVEGVWKETSDYDIQISEECLNKWPEEGDLAEMNDQFHIIEDDKKEKTDNKTPDDTNFIGEDNTESKNKNKNEKFSFDRDGNDEGPAPLQNTEVPLETFEGVVNVTDISNTQAGNASMAVERIEETID